ncbi:MAG: 6-bladed beta-propeller [Nitrospirae bacterium]|nr:6-bladed beta-propeller [Nitrospirota bacterium]
MFPALKQPWYFNYPEGIAIDGKNNIYIADTKSHRLLKYASDGQFMTGIGSKGTDLGYFDNPIGVAVDKDSNIYVTDTFNNRVQKMAVDGTITEVVNKNSCNGMIDINRLSGVAVDDAGYIYIVDTNKHRVYKISPQGVCAAWGTEGIESGQFKYPYGVAVDKLYVYVTDMSNHRIQKFDKTGKFLKTWGQYGSGDGQFYNPVGISIGKDGNIYVADSYNNRIQVFTTDGTLVDKWESMGSGAGELLDPYGVAIDSNNYVYVTDRDNLRIQKFTKAGGFIDKWAASGQDDGLFKYPGGIAINPGGDAYVVDEGNNRIQRFSPGNIFKAQWGNKGLGDGQFDFHCELTINNNYDTIEIVNDNNKDNCIHFPAGIASDAQGNIYVADWGNYRIQEFSPDGTHMINIGSYGSGDTQLKFPSGIALDASGNIYVADTLNHRVVKFSAYGNYIFKIGSGSAGNGDGQFSYPAAVAVDLDGNIYVADFGNHRIQKFDSQGKFVMQWGSYGFNEMQFKFPSAIAIDSSNNIYVTELRNHRIQEFTPNGFLLDKWGTPGSSAGDLNEPVGIAFGSGGNPNSKPYIRPYIVDSTNHRVEVFAMPSDNKIKKAIIVAGSGPYNNNIWDSIEYNANLAYRTLRLQGLTSEQIYYLSSDKYLNLDGSYVVKDDANTTNLKNAIMNWAMDATDVIVYLVGHGDTNKFKISITEDVNASELQTWLDNLQKNIKGKVIVVYDACRSGSFMEALTSPVDGKRLFIASTSASEEAYFISTSNISFSRFFWNSIVNGNSIYNAYAEAEDGMGRFYNNSDNNTANTNCLNRKSVLDDCNNGSIAETFYIGNNKTYATTRPTIGSVSSIPPQLNGQNSAKISAGSVKPFGNITRVWAEISTPDAVPSSTSTPVTSLPSFELIQNPDTGSYEATYDGFDKPGSYLVIVYALDKTGNISSPQTLLLQKTSSSSPVAASAETPLCTLPPYPALTLRVNCSFNDITIKTEDTLSIKVALSPNQRLGSYAYFWLYAQTPIGNYHYDAASNSWKQGLSANDVSYSGYLRDLPLTKIEMSGLPEGGSPYIFNFDIYSSGCTKDGNKCSKSIKVNVNK